MDSDRSAALLRWMGVLALVFFGGWVGYQFGQAKIGPHRALEDYERALYLLELQLAMRPAAQASTFCAAVAACTLLILIALVALWRADRTPAFEGDILEVLMKSNASVSLIRRICRPSTDAPERALIGPNHATASELTLDRPPPTPEAAADEQRAKLIPGD